MKKSQITSLLILVFGLFFTTASAQNPEFYLSSNGAGYNVIEGNTYTFTAKLYAVSTTPVVINITTTNNTTASNDYTALSTTVTIPAGQLSSSSLSIVTTNDATIELNESFTITGTVTSANTSNITDDSSVTIIDNDKTPMVNVYYNYTIVESRYFYINISLSNPFTSDVVINYNTSTGTASAGDFTAINSTLTIPAGQTYASITVYTIDDAIIEPDENFSVNFTVTSGNTTNTSVPTTITIIDNDVTPTMRMYIGDQFRVNENSTSNNMNVLLDRAYNTDVVVSLVTSNGTAGASDYTATSITKTIIAGETYVSFNIPITNDTLDEPVESFVVTSTVTSGNTINATATATLSIVDDDGLPDFYFYAGNGYGGIIEEGSNMPIRVALTYPSLIDTIIQVTTANGTAGSLDYTPLTTTVTIPAGITFYSTVLYVPTLLDQLQEPTETFTINGLVTSGNVYSNSESAVLSITDNYIINAQNDYVNSTAEVGTTYQLFSNDTLHGLPLNATNATITLVETNTIGVTLNPQGVLTIPSSLPLGSYGMNYTICETANPGNCDTSHIYIRVKSPLEITYTASYSDYNGDGYTSVGDVINFQYTITNIGNGAITNVDFDYLYNLIPSGGPLSVLNIGQSDSTTFSSSHVLSQFDINHGYSPEGVNNGGLTFKGNYYGYAIGGYPEMQGSFNLPHSDGIILNAFVDANANGVQDAGSEINFNLGHFNYEINNNGTIYNEYSTPFYLYESNPTAIYNLSYTVDSQYTANNSCTANYPNVTVAPGSGLTTYNFPITVTPYQDLSVNLMSFNPAPRPGFYYSQYISYTNNSNQTVASGTVTFTKDPALSIYNVSQSGATVSATGFTYNFTNLLPYETRHISVTTLVPTIPTVALGQLVTNSVAITIPAGDILPLNNTSSITQTIVGSYDPNEKTESHGGQIVNSTFTSNDYLTYTIRFENTGTANAININVEDFLDSKLEPSSIKMITASAAYSLERINNHLTWKFSGINLPPSIPDNEKIGHGYIVFQVKPKAGYTIGDVIPNTANIFFDFNPAIVTNTCTTEFVLALGTKNFAFSNFNYFPNPVKNTLSISNDSTIDAIEITSVLGQKMFSKNVNELQTEVNLSELSNGIYFVKVTSEGQEKTVKIVKE